MHTKQTKVQSSTRAYGVQPDARLMRFQWVFRTAMHRQGCDAWRSGQANVRLADCVRVDYKAHARASINIEKLLLITVSCKVLVARYTLSQEL